MTVAVFFAAVEGLLALCNVHPVVETDDPFLGFAASIPLYTEQAQPDGSIVLTTANNKRAYFNDQHFLKTKPEGTFRIFCMGGSTTYGRPFDDTTSFAGWLRELLPLADGARKWEVINAGGISYASYRVAALMQELARYEPDLFIVYTGQNEFLERRTYAKLVSSPRLVGVSALLARTRLYAAMSSLLNTTDQDHNSTASPREVLPAEVDAILDRSVGPEDYHRDELQHDQIVAHFEYNLGRMVRIARSAGADILFLTPASNLKDCSPFKSEPAVDLSPELRARRDEALREAARSFDDGRVEQSAERYQQALKFDDHSADTWYAYGRALFQLGRYDAAGDAFRRARDEDVCPLRALTSMPRIVARIAREQAAALVDFEAIVGEMCRREHGHAIPGSEYFLDHVHPNVETTGRLAKVIVDALVQRGLVHADEQSWNAAAVELAAGRIEDRVDPRLQAVSLRNLAKVLNWAGKREEAARLARESLRELPNDPESLCILATDLRNQGKRDEAIDACHRALPYLHNNVTPHVLLSQLLAEGGEFERARAHLDEALRIKPDSADVHVALATVLLNLQQPDEAIAHFQRGLELRPGDPRLHYHLGAAWAVRGDLDRAVTHLDEALRRNPRDAEAHNCMGLLLVRQGRLPEAIGHYQRALAVQPDHQEARRNLAAAERLQVLHTTGASTDD